MEVLSVLLLLSVHLSGLSGRVQDSGELSEDSLVSDSLMLPCDEKLISQNDLISDLLFLDEKLEMNDNPVL
jgi:hypothetical protein